jgi:hypothetical protein
MEAKVIYVQFWMVSTFISFFYGLFITDLLKKFKKTNSVAFSPQANYTDWLTATCQRNLMPTFVDRGVSRGQREGSPMVFNLTFLDRSRHFSFK